MPTPRVAPAPAPRQPDGEQPPRVGDPTGNLEELLHAIGLEELFLTMPAHLQRTFPGPLYGVRYLPVPDLPPVVFALAHLREAPPLVRAFAAVGRATAAAEAVVRAYRASGTFSVTSS